MHQEDKDNPGGSGPKPEPPPVVYASPVKRVWAWVGIAYMLFFLATFTYHLATAEYLIGLGPLFVCPALGGLTATVILRHRAGQGRGGRLACVLLAGGSLVLLVVNLVVGIQSLGRNFGG